jgi:hypothetical protein
MEHDPMFKHNEDDGKRPHDIEAIDPVFIIGMQNENIPQLTGKRRNNLHEFKSSAAKIGKQTEWGISEIRDQRSEIRDRRSENGGWKNEE